MEIDEALVAHVAQLARLGLAPEEAARLKEDFRRILGFVEKLNEIDTEGVEPSIFAVEIANVLREDEARRSLPTEAVLANSPQALEGYFLVPRIVDASATFEPASPDGEAAAGGGEE